MKQSVNDIVYTNHKMAKAVIRHFKPTGSILDPCAGANAFYSNFPKKCIKYRCEIADGIDFFKFNKKVDWIISNPPYSIYRNFLTHAFSVANNVVFLIPVSKIFYGKQVDDEINKYGGLKEIISLGSGRSAGFPFGFTICAVHYKKNYKGKCKITYKHLINAN